MMKCPTCKSKKFRQCRWDHEVMECEDCHSTHSVTWCAGYWQGYLDGEREALEKVKSDK